VTLATDSAAQAAVKRCRTRSCPLFDTDFFRRQIEAAYEKMWQTWLARRPASAQ
jgi:predicted O-linked N-acetylglucosamine transferase (SPINDLY family)